MTLPKVPTLPTLPTPPSDPEKSEAPKSFKYIHLRGFLTLSTVGPDFGPKGVGRVGRVGTHTFRPLVEGIR
jgi:hypothetical protein